jgi:hypothetical protein
MLARNPASDKVQITCRLALQAARWHAVVGALARAGPGAVADELDRPDEYLPGPHEMLPAEPELAGTARSAHGHSQADQRIGAICGYPGGLGRVALDVFSGQLDGHAEGGDDAACIRDPDDDWLCGLRRIVVLLSQGTQLPAEELKIVIRYGNRVLHAESL